MLQLLLLLPLAWFGWMLLVATVGVCVQAADRNQPLSVDARLIALVAREAGARALLGVAGWFTFGRPDPMPSPVSPNRPLRRSPPVLLLPGLGWSRASLAPLRTFLVRRGFPWVWAVDRGGVDFPLAAEAEALGHRIEELCRSSGSPSVDVVAFGTGGLVAAWYLRHHGAARVRRLVTMGTPWQGTRLAVFRGGRAVGEVRFGSHALDGLWPPPVPTTCIHSPDDPVVVPASSAAPATGGELVAVEAAGHVDLLLSARVYRAVQVALEQARASEPLVPAAGADGWTEQRSTEAGVEAG